MPCANKIFDCGRTCPKLSNKLVLERYARFNGRHRCEIAVMRLAERIDFKSFAVDTDYFRPIGEQHTFCPQCYMVLGKLALNYLPLLAQRIISS